MAFLDEVGLARFKSKNDETYAPIAHSHKGEDITSGTVAAERIANLDAAKITTGTFADARIPALAASKITSGTFDAARIPELDASKIATGTISIDRLPAAALERLVNVADDAARFKLTEDQVQLGDTVKVADTGKMYLIKDVSKLGTEAGYEEYTAGSASSVPWSGVTGAPDFPNLYAAKTHTHTISQITDIADANVAGAGKLTGSAAAAGSATQPVYFVNGVPTACTYKLNKDVPADAKFTDTVYTLPTASATAKGGVQLGYTATGNNVPLNVDADGKAYVTVAPYAHPSHTAHAAGLYKIAVDALGHVSAATAVAKSDITALGIPAQDTTYTAVTATGTDAGLMSVADKAKLDGIAANANNYSLPLATDTVRGGVKVGYTANGKKYPVQLDAEKMFVEVPWQNTTYSVMGAASATVAGTSGLVPASKAGDQAKFLRADGTWVAPTNTTYSAISNDTIDALFA